MISLDFQTSKLPENQTACSTWKQVTLFWRENIKLIDSDKRDYLQKEQTANEWFVRLAKWFPGKRLNEPLSRFE